MSFIEYLEKQGINQMTSGNEGIIYQMLKAWTLPMDYRHLSCLMDGLPKIEDAFNKLWYDYENELNIQEYEPHII